MSTPSQNAIPFAPFFTTEDRDQSEANYNQTWGVRRRVLMGFLSVSSDQFLDNLRREDPEILLTMVETICEYRGHLLIATHLADTALDRLVAVGDYLDKVAVE